MAASISRTVRYGWFLLFIAGLGGLLYGIDVGIIAAALLYLNKTINLTVEQTSIIVAAVLGGSMFSSLVAGVLADWFGRKRMMIVSGMMFVASVGLIVVSQGFVALVVGRLLQGMSGGVIAVVVPLYLAECLGPDNRGRGTAIFQFMLTFGIVIAAVTGWFYTRGAEAAIAAAAGNRELILAAENHAWRGMFLSVIYPGIVFFLGAFFLSESPRWLTRRGRSDEALAALRRSTSEDEAQLQMKEMQTLADENLERVAAKSTGSLLQRKYVIPFVLACVILGLNQATGINSVLGFLVIILKQAGMTASHATQGDVAVKVLNCVMTIVAVALVDKKGRKFLLKLGTGGIVLALAAGGLFFLGFESKRADVKAQVVSAERDNSVALPLSSLNVDSAAGGRSMVLTVLYSYGSGDNIATVLNDSPGAALAIAPEKKSPPVSHHGLMALFDRFGSLFKSDDSGQLVIKRALYGPVPPERTGWLITACLGLFIASYSVGPGVVVWLALSELMPTRIRSTGMGIALLLNQGVSTLIAAVFLPVVGHYGFFAMFFFWSACTVIYFLTAAFFLPETKGRTLEEIEMHFEKGGSEALT